MVLDLVVDLSILFLISISILIFLDLVFDSGF